MRRSSATLLLLVMTAVLLWVSTARAEETAETDEWRLRLIYPSGAGQETALDTSFGGGDYTLDEPYIPVRLLAGASGIPLGWYKSGTGSVAVWGGSPISLVFVSDRQDIFYVMDAAAPDYTKVYHEEHFSAPRLLGGSFCLPLAFLDHLGLEYELDAAARLVTVYLSGSAGHTVDPGLVWQAAQADVSPLLEPQSVLLASATTYFDDSLLDRSQNIYLAADSLHRQVISPGTTFSFNAAVGPRTPERGYRRAMIFSGGKPVLGYGGGVCQVSTTLYQAVLQAGMQIVERHPHSLAVSYAVAGRDATVVWGARDLRWRNNTAQTVYLLCSITGGTLTVEIWQGDLPQDTPGILVIK